MCLSIIALHLQSLYNFYGTVVEDRFICEGEVTYEVTGIKSILTILGVYS